MNTFRKQKEKSIAIGLVSLVILIAILTIIGFFLTSKGDETIQGQAEATQVRISGKLPGRVTAFFVTEGEMVSKGDTLVEIFSSDAEAKLMQAEAMKNVYMAQNQKVDAGARKEVIAGAYDMWQEWRLFTKRVSFQRRKGMRLKRITKLWLQPRGLQSRNMKWPRTAPR